MGYEIKKLELIGKRKDGNKTIVELAYYRPSYIGGMLIHEMARFFVDVVFVGKKYNLEGIGVTPEDATQIEAFVEENKLSLIK